MPACTNHGDRPGVGVCMRCRKVICADCCTRLDGINHCPACLEALARAAMPSAARPRAAGPGLAPLAAVALFGLSALVLAGLGWLGQGLLAP
jgi:hypothetical protein